MTSDTTSVFHTTEVPDTADFRSNRAAETAAPAAATSKRIAPQFVIDTIALADGLLIFAGGIVLLLQDAFAKGTSREAAFFVLAFVTLLSINLLRPIRRERTAGRAALNIALMKIFGVWLGCIAVAFLLMRITVTPDRGSQILLIAWAIAMTAFVTTTHLAAFLAVRYWDARGRIRTRVAVLGSGAIAQRLITAIGAQGDPNATVIGVFDDRNDGTPGCTGHPLLGGMSDLVDEIHQGRIDNVVVAIPLAEQRLLEETLTQLELLPVDVQLCPDEFGLRIGMDRRYLPFDATLLNVQKRPFTGWRGIVKRAEDLILAASISVVILPLFLVIAMAVKLTSPGPVFFRQKRLGLNNEMIEVFKFRTMYLHATDHNGEQQTTRNDPRVTRVGEILRQISLDELPQLINVLRGEMSIVGPRPHARSSKAGGILFPDAVRRYYARHRVKPGITGWAQVNGWRGETQTVEQLRNRVEHDLYYIENWSLGFDVLIVLRTLVTGFINRNAY
jgi:Undecaprenyl-phosphate glucose phosphotransferase